MKTTIKLVLFVCLFSSVAFADGEMGSGGKTCPSGCLVAPQAAEKDMVNTETENYILKFVQKYLFSIFG